MLNVPNRDATPTKPIAAIKIGNRHRHDLGNVGLLAASIADVGLLHPIVITFDRTLIAGARRIAACRQLGWTNIPVTIVNLDQIVLGEFAENAHHKNFLPSEIGAIRREIEPLEKAVAKERQRKHGGTAPGKHSGQISASDAGKTRDEVGAFAGVSGRTVEKIGAVVDAAEAEPEKYGHLVAVMDRTGRVDGMFNRLKVIRGKPTIDLTNQTTLLMAPARAHSEKPDAFFAMVKTLCPAPRYAYLFARRSPGENWDCHGDVVVKAWDEAAE